MRDRLIELLRDTLNCEEKTACINCEYNRETDCKLKRKADYLLANGVIAPPCWIDDKIYFVCGYNMAEYTIKRIEYDLLFWQFHCENPAYSIEHREFSFFNERIGKTVFLTREEAEQALKERSNLET